MSVLLTIAPVLAVADEIMEVVKDVADKIVQQLPMDKKIVLKSLSADKTGLPEDFLRRLVSDFEASLLVKSKFSIDLLNRTTTEDLWEEATEFGDANFTKLYEASKADIMMLLNSRATLKGFEISASAYELVGANSGKLIASSGVVSLEIDLKNTLGVDIKNIDNQVADIITKIQKIARSGGLIEGPADFADFYHNARIYQQRGQNDYALANYQEAIELENLFYDPLYDYLELLVAKFGLRLAEVAFENQMQNSLTEEQVAFASVYFSQSVVDFFPTSIVPKYDVESDTYIDPKFLKSDEPYFRGFSPPTHALFLKKYGDTLQSAFELESFSDFSAQSEDIAQTAKLAARYLLSRSANEVLNSYQSGQIGKFFIDDLKGSVFIDSDKTKQYLKAARAAYFAPRSFTHFYGTSGLIATGGITEEESGVDTTIFRMSEKTNVTIDNDFLSAAKDAVDGYSGENLDPDHWDNVRYPCGYGGSFVDGNKTALGPSVVAEKKFPNVRHSVLGPFQIPRTIVFPIYADKCIEHFANIGMPKSIDKEYYTPAKSFEPAIDYRGRKEKNGITLVGFNISIFDDVDTSQPILLNVVTPDPGEGGASYTVDITADGTQFANGLFWLQTPEDQALLKVYLPKVLTTDGIVQSSIAYDVKEHIPSFVSYYDMRGEYQNLAISEMDLFFVKEAVALETLERKFFDQYILDFPGSISSINLSELSAMYKASTSNDRRYLQKSLLDMGFYKSSVDGKWGKGTESAFRQLFDYLDSYYPDRQYLADFGLNDGDISRDEFVNFWNKMYGCDEGMLLSITSACGS